MCGIVGYAGPPLASGGAPAQDGGLPVVLEGLRRLEYRGYDSAGVAVRTGDGQGATLSTAKKAGKLANLEKVLAERPLPKARYST